MEKLMTGILEAGIVVIITADFGYQADCTSNNEISLIDYTYVGGRIYFYALMADD